jgi:excinuclease ABC subunit A
VLDEPSVGLHPRDKERLAVVLRKLAAAGNAVVVVEHDPIFIRYADRVIDIGPGPGKDGGRVIHEGTVAGLIHRRESPRHLPRGGSNRAAEKTGTIRGNYRRRAGEQPEEFDRPFPPGNGGLRDRGERLGKIDAHRPGPLPEPEEVDGPADDGAGDLQDDRGVEKISDAVLVDQSPLPAAPA